MKRHKWGIAWLVQIAWNSAFVAWDLTSGRYALAGFMAALAVFCGVMAYLDLTKVGRVTITIRPDTRAFDAAMKRAQEAKP